MTEEEKENIRLAIVCGEIIGYCMQNIKGKHLFKQRLNLVRNSVKTLESFFGQPFKKEFNRNEYLMLKKLLEGVIDFDDDTLEIILNSIKKNVNPIKIDNNGDGTTI